MSVNEPMALPLPGWVGRLRGEVAMSDMLTEMAPELMWTISDDRESVRLQLPPLQIEGMPEPLRIHLDFDAEMVDEILKRLSVLRSEMLPSPLKN